MLYLKLIEKRKKMANLEIFKNTLISHISHIQILLTKGITLTKVIAIVQFQHTEKMQFLLVSNNTHSELL